MNLEWIVPRVQDQSLGLLIYSPVLYHCAVTAPNYVVSFIKYSICGIRTWLLINYCGILHCAENVFNNRWTLYNSCTSALVLSWLFVHFLVLKFLFLLWVSLAPQPLSLSCPLPPSPLSLSTLHPFFVSLALSIFLWRHLLLCIVFPGDIYVVGATNAGKSSLFNQLIQSDFCKAVARDFLERATTSVWPG